MANLTWMLIGIGGAALSGFFVYFGGWAIVIVENGVGLDAFADMRRALVYSDYGIGWDDYVRNAAYIGGGVLTPLLTLRLARDLRRANAAREAAVVRVLTIGFSVGALAIVIVRWP